MHQQLASGKDTVCLTEKRSIVVSFRDMIVGDMLMTCHELVHVSSGKEPPLDSPEFWDWIIQKERKKTQLPDRESSIDNDTTNGKPFEPLPLYIEIDNPVNIPVSNPIEKPKNTEKPENDSDVDFVVYQL